MNKWEEKSYRLMWWDDKCRWPEFTQPFNDEINYTVFIDQYRERVEWIYENLENCTKHSRWCLDGHGTNNLRMRFCFRRETDMTRFVLRWS